MYRTTYLTNSSHAKLSRLRDSGQIKSVMSFVNQAVNKALAELQAPKVPETAPTNEIVITIKVNGGQIS